MTRPLLEIAGLRKEFPVRRGLLGRLLGTVRAVDGVDLAVSRGECLALVGESGCGKTTIARCALRLVEPTAGSVRFDGEDLLALRPRELRRRRRRFQMVFQDPYGSLDPRQRIGSVVGEPLEVHESGLSRKERGERVRELLGTVGLPPEMTGRWPHELSGGQRQRVGIARALAAGPELLAADEPVTALDVSIRGQILSLLEGLRERLGLALLLIAHDMAAVERLADRVAVLYLGRIVELAPRAALFSRPLHPYTVILLSAVPRSEPGRRRSRIVLAGEPPSPLAPPPGCPFHPRCPIARPRCSNEVPPLVEVEPPLPRHGGEGWGEGGRDQLPGHLSACFYPGELTPASGNLSRAHA